MNVARFSVIFQLLILGCETATSALKNRNTNILCNGHHSVLLHSMKTAVNFMRPLTSVNGLYVA